MKRASLAAVASIALALSWACDGYVDHVTTTAVGSGQLVTETRPVGGFTAVVVSGAGHLTIEQTGVESLQVTAEELGEPGKDDHYGFGLVSAEVYRLGNHSDFRITKTKIKSDHGKVQTVTLAGAEFEVTITNAGLSKLSVEVFEGDASVPLYSDRYRFGPKDPQQVTFTLAGNSGNVRVLDFVFAAGGKSGAYAEVDIVRN